MKNKFNILQALSNHINFDYFYSVSITSNWIKLQGTYALDKMLFFLNNEITFEFDQKNNWYIAKNLVSKQNINNHIDKDLEIEIILTK